MLNCTETSQAKKTAGIAVVYRAGTGEMFGTCPDTCALKPEQTGTKTIDRDYERAVRRAVPRRGISFLFTHFKPGTWAEKNRAGFCVFNYSADKIRDAVQYVKKGVSTVTVVPVNFWDDKKKKTGIKIDGAQFVRCPNETNKDIGCARCGNGTPLCARGKKEGWRYIPGGRMLCRWWKCSNSLAQPIQAGVAAGNRRGAHNQIRSGFSSWENHAPAYCRGPGPSESSYEPYRI